MIYPAYVMLPVYVAKTILEATDHLIGMIKPTYDRFFIRLFAAVGMNMLMLPKDYERVFETIRSILRKWKGGGYR